MDVDLHIKTSDREGYYEISGEVDGDPLARQLGKFDLLGFLQFLIMVEDPDDGIPIL